MEIKGIQRIIASGLSAFYFFLFIEKMENIRTTLLKYILQQSDTTIINYLSRVWDQDTVKEAKEHYPNDIRSQLDYYINNSSDTCIEASFDWILECGLIDLFTKEALSTNQLD